MQSAMAKCRNMVVLLFFLILWLSKVLMDSVFPMVEMITKPKNDNYMNGGIEVGVSSGR